jgi:S1-C subfamily serine protease
MEKPNKNKSWLIVWFLLFNIVGLAAWNCFLYQNQYSLKTEFANQSLVNIDTANQITALAEVTNNKISDLSDFIIQRNNANLRLIRSNQEALFTINSKIPDPNLLPKLAKRITPSIVKIEVHLGFDEFTGEEISWSGSGVFVAPNLILTAGHVVDKVVIEQNADSEYIWKVEPPIVVKLVDGTELKVVDVYQADPSLTDLGLLRVEVPNDVNVPTPLKFGVVEVGEQVFAIGEPFKLFPTLTSGIVSA